MFTSCCLWYLKIVTFIIGFMDNKVQKSVEKMYCHYQLIIPVMTKFLVVCTFIKVLLFSRVIFSPIFYFRQQNRWEILVPDGIIWKIPKGKPLQVILRKIIKKTVFLAFLWIYSNSNFILTQIFVNLRVTPIFWSVSHYSLINKYWWYLSREIYQRKTHK